ncbi:MAG: LPS assembly protein LptD [Proteobacteria bacterium]|nr:LPS assembly protein LptD [Pseudomonadota bacterium]
MPTTAHFKSPTPRRLALLLFACLAAAFAVAESDGSEARERKRAEPSQTTSGPPGGWEVDVASAYWVTRENLDERRLNRMPVYCEGMYVGPAFENLSQTQVNAQPVLTDADRVEYLADGTLALKGNVSVTQGNRRLYTRDASINEVTRDSRLSGGVRLEQSDIVMRSSDAQVNLKSQEATLNDVQFVLIPNEFRGQTEQVHQDEAGNLTMTANRFTRCEPGNNSWEISTDTLTVEKDAVFGVAKNAVLRVKDVPVFYVPYLKFPVTDERQSGLLFPDLRYSGEDGVDVTLPYYLNLAEDYDATIVPRFISKRGIGVEGEFRTLGPWHATTMGAGYLPEDDQFNGTLSKSDWKRAIEAGDPVPPTFKPADRWLVALDHRGAVGNFQSDVDYTAVSDRDYFRDLGSELGISSRIDLERTGQVRYARSGFTARVWAQEFQRLDEVAADPYQRIPEIELGYLAARVGPFDLSVGGKWTAFDRDTDGLSALEAVTGERLHIEPRIQLPLTWAAGFLNFTGAWRYTEYDLEDDSNNPRPVLKDEHVERSIGLFSVDGGLIFERDIKIADTGLIQTLEPRLFYLYQEFEDQSGLPRFDASDLTFGYRSLFRDNRFSGLDRLGDADQLSAGVTTRFLDQGNGREYLRASIGSIFYFEDRRVTLRGPATPEDRQTTSALATEISSEIARNWRVKGSLMWNPHNNQVDEGSAGIQYKRDNRHIVNLGFRNRREDDIEQTDLSVYWPINDRFSGMAKWNYDLVSGRTIEAFAGIEYNDCCWQVRLIARTFLDAPAGRDFEDIEADNGIFLQIFFRGLSSFGGSAESVLQRGIKGYRTEANYEEW